MIQQTDFKFWYNDEGEVTNKEEEAIFHQMLETAKNTTHLTTHIGYDVYVGKVNGNQYYIHESSEAENYQSDATLFIYTNFESFKRKAEELAPYKTDEKYLNEIFAKVEKE